MARTKRARLRPLALAMAVVLVVPPKATSASPAAARNATPPARGALQRRPKMVTTSSRTGMKASVQLRALRSGPEGIGCAVGLVMGRGKDTRCRWGPQRVVATPQCRVAATHQTKLGFFGPIAC